ncbi:ubiquinone/menaquinone biosynthesis C-methylase UbiE [Novosphingobium chloroacetimidivorans]|uniref:Ubiquinone/menaquinone biosynthesis C-methylase UbiE n=1 Tax=Novosphingobium chloroacetimidivorans TaxID=1428314 RepID=A0A7W7K6F6_9SPHN|nr:class I SAM-dependent methyltransferase [Novosphingobium chloroacetimidivorans]MBB4857117.1 ubiquinone/menaquinone biosynthesis C-methylase UbiE [Novosphingobium chloroacetimidivorans]
MVAGFRFISCAVLALAALTSGCENKVEDGRAASSRAFPRADRPVSNLGANGFSSETERDSVNEARTVMDLAGIAKGMSVADLGAGEGYYTVRLAQRVGSEGRVLAQDIDSEALRNLGLRIERERLDNVSIKQGAEDDPRLPANSFDRVMLVHMYHEVGEPYAFLWHLRPALRPGGSVVVVDVDRPTESHGIPPALLFCEFEAVGFRLAEFVRKPKMQGYYARFEAKGAAPAPEAIRPCRLAGSAPAAAR